MRLSALWIQQSTGLCGQAVPLIMAGNADDTLGRQLATSANKAGSDSRPKWVNAAGPAIPGSLQLGVFGLRLRQGRNVGVGILPKREKVLVCGAGFGGVALQNVSASKAEMR